MALTFREVSGGQRFICKNDAEVITSGITVYLKLIVPNTPSDYNVVALNSGLVSKMKDNEEIVLVKRTTNHV